MDGRNYDQLTGIVKTLELLDYWGMRQTQQKLNKIMQLYLHQSRIDAITHVD